ncbi:premnaspirodiene oxygenase-like [Solanum stenotomum]|uniref:premnaspirodiene oxygenase-like n=1 Tax=Solanum stenotomum TaxID=172797 RepID=UPI0020D08DA4|nr:premnaspirodiene oxygenase-like [Solanum stenotomum]
MEMFNSFLSNLVLLLLFLSSLILIVKKWRKPKNRNEKQFRLPPGPWRLPLIGNLHHLIGGGLPHHIFRKLSQRYGPLMYLQLGEVPTVVISSTTIAKEILRTHDHAFACRPQLTSTDIIFYNSIDIAFSPYGDYWRQMRKICTLELFSIKMIKLFSAIREDELTSLISSIRSMRGSPVNMTKKIFLFTNCIICRSAFGKVCKDRGEFLTTLKEVLLLAAGFFMADLYPSWKLLHNLRGEKTRMVNAHKKVDAVMKEILNEHIENKAAGKKGNGEFGDEDLVDVLLRVKENAELQYPITNDHIKAVIFDIFLGGTGSSSSTIIWALSEMIKNPNVMIKAQSEVRRVFKGKQNFSEEEVENLTYLKSVIKETLRLHTPAPLLGSRECREQTVIDGYTIPLKARVLVNAWELARDPESWDDPENFIPERFENSSIDFMGNHFEFIPFGSGRRVCPGLLLGFANVIHPLAQLLYHFEWELPNGTNPKDLDMTETHGLTAEKKENLYLIAIDYRNNEEF